MKVSLVFGLIVGIIILHLLSTTDAAKKGKPTKDYKANERYTITFTRKAKRKHVKALAKWLEDKNHKIDILKRRNGIIVKGKMTERRLARLRRNKNIKLIAEDAVVKMACTDRNLADDAQGLDILDGKIDQAYNVSVKAIDNRVATDVYVIDSGVLANHDEFSLQDGSSRVELMRNFYPDISNYHTHGTMVAGLAAGNTYGADDLAFIKDYRVLDHYGTGYATDVTIAVDGAMDRHKLRPAGAKSVLVLAISVLTNNDDTLIDMEETIAAAAAIPGMYVVSAAGNFYSNANDYLPCRIPNVICTGTVNNLDQISDFSNYGPSVDILVKGTDMRSALRASPQATGLITGTSASAGLMGGAVSLYLSDYAPNAVPSRAQVMSYFTQHASVATLTASRRNAGTTNMAMQLPPCQP